MGDVIVLNAITRLDLPSNRVFDAARDHLVGIEMTPGGPFWAAS